MTNQHTQVRVQAVRFVGDPKRMMLPDPTTATVTYSHRVQSRYDGSWMDVGTECVRVDKQTSRHLYDIVRKGATWRETHSPNSNVIVFYPREAIIVEET